MRGTRFAAVACVILFSLSSVAGCAGPTESKPKGAWVTRAPLPSVRLGMGVGVANGIIYGIGGYFGEELATVEAYDPATDVWTTKSSMPTARDGVGIGVVGNTVYAFGGRAPFPTNVVEAYDPATDRWTAKASMPTARSYMGVGVIDGIIYVVGGDDGATSLGNVEAYDPAKDMWTTRAAMPTARSGLAIGVVDGVLYAVGGWGNAQDHSAAVEAYDPKANRWTNEAPLQWPTSGIAAGTIDGVLYTVGGCVHTAPTWGGDVAAISLVYGYHPWLNFWTKAPPIPTARCYTGVGVVNGKLYAIGGVAGGSGYLYDKVDEFTP